LDLFFCVGRKNEFKAGDGKEEKPNEASLVKQSVKAGSNYKDVDCDESGEKCKAKIYQIPAMVFVTHTVGHYTEKVVKKLIVKMQDYAAPIVDGPDGRKVPVYHTSNSMDLSAQWIAEVNEKEKQCAARPCAKVHDIDPVREFLKGKPVANAT
jgi:hypothetical protein